MGKEGPKKTLKCMEWTVHWYHKLGHCKPRRCVRGVDVALFILSISIRLWCVTSLMCQRLYTRWKWPQFLLHRKQGGPLTWFGHYEEKRLSCPWWNLTPILYSLYKLNWLYCPCSCLNSDSWHSGKCAINVWLYVNIYCCKIVNVLVVWGW